MKKVKEKIANFFDFKGNDTNYSKEIRGGIITFLAM